MNEKRRRLSNIREAIQIESDSRAVAALDDRRGPYYVCQQSRIQFSLVLVTSSILLSRISILDIIFNILLLLLFSTGHINPDEIILGRGGSSPSSSGSSSQGASPERAGG